jgi:FixJ family two-component response regulator
LSSEKPICVIDDDASVRLSLEGLLRSLGHTVRVFASAEEFLDSNALPSCGCIISDIKMPGMSGLELKQRLDGAGAAPPFILMTAFADEAARARAAKAGAACFLSKPFDADALIECLKNAMRG